MKVKILRAQEMDQALTMAEAVEVVKDAFAQLSLKKAQAPLRTSLTIRSPEEVALTMPAYLGDTGALGTKMVTVFPENPKSGLPAVQALMVLFDALHGFPLALLEGTHLTGFRTGAATGVATQILSRQDSKTLALFGAGGQSYFQVMGVVAVRKITRIKIFDLLPERVDSLIGLLRANPLIRDIGLLKAESSAQALEGADIIVTATSSVRPVFDGTRLQPGMHINAIGAFRPEMQEVDEETIRRSRIFVDSRKACLEEAGDLVVPLKKGLIEEERILAEIGEIAAGKKPGRKTAEEITYFKSVGNAVQDVSVAQAIYRRAQEKGLGQEIEL